MSLPQTRWGAPVLGQPAFRRGGIGAPAQSRPTGTPATPLRVLGRPHRRRLRPAQRPKLVVMGGAAVICLVLLGVVAAHVMLAQSQLRLDRLDNRLAAQVALHQRLELQVAQLESPTRIVSTAQQRLHMVVPSSVTYLSPKAPTAQAPTAQAPTAQAPTAQAPTAQAPTAQAPTAPVPSSGPARTGTTAGPSRR